MNINDIFNQAFINGYSSAPITMVSILTCMLISGILAFYLFLLYRFVSRKAFYNKNFNISIFAIAIIVSGIVLTIQSNLVVSLSMAGVLSIIRFRTAIKDPMDLIFLFWAIAVGIISGVGLAEIAFIVTIILTIGILILQKLPIATAPKILVINGERDMSVEEVQKIVKKYSKYNVIKSRSIRDGYSDMIIELRPTNELILVDEIDECQGVVSVSLLSHDGEVTF